MPAEGVVFAHKHELLTWDELLRMAQAFIDLGVDKIRITGGEPFVRKGLMDFLEKLANIEDLKEISITTNATLIAPHIDHLKRLGITKINVSIDSLDEDRFNQITRRKHYKLVMENIMMMIDKGFDVKFNCVVMDDTNTDDIIPMVEFARKHKVTVRFLEEMPFNGQTTGVQPISWDYIRITEHIKAHFGPLERLPVPASSTSINYRVPGSAGSFGVIASYSRTFCGTCNRVRVSAKGEMQTCLYSADTINLMPMIRNHASLSGLQFSIIAAMKIRAKDGFEAENQNITKKSMTLIGG
ncbi:GTP 3',8-cyclase 2 [Echinicola pacifica]|uniref:GTP 3',8-cyclase 2 n=2 Tax=Echinicola pacifica TaxID=346377 RepID=A0A918Q058_9BACT|nr:GTP 3',8-cyclase 2 [Echinicola pacifica]